jgi:hypothetical protein
MCAIDQRDPKVKSLLTKIVGDITLNTPHDLDNATDAIKTINYKELHRLLLVGIHDDTEAVYTLTYMWTLIMQLAKFSETAVGVRPDFEMLHILNYLWDITDFLNLYECTGFSQQIMKNDASLMNLVMTELAKFKADMGTFNQSDEELVVYAPITIVGKQSFKTDSM